MGRALVIKIAVGEFERERLTTALTVAATAAAAAVPVTVWLAGDAAWLGVSAAPPSDDDASELFDALLPQAQVVLCSRCADRRGITAGDLRAGVEIKGAAAFVADITRPGVQALVY